MKCKFCGGVVLETYGVVYQDMRMTRRAAYGPGFYCPSCHTFQLQEDLNDTRLERAGNED